jgi:hypothetical protein
MTLEIVVNDTAVAVSRKYFLVDPDDIAQELWVWLSSHPRKLVEWNADELGEPKLRKALKREGSRYAQREQEARRQLGLDRDTGQDY